MGIVELKEGTLVFRQGDQKVTIKVEKKTAGEAVKKKLPKSVLMSLLPIFEEAYDVVPNILSPERSFWTRIKQEAAFSQEQAINLARRHQFSVEETSENLMDLALVISGTVGEERELAKEAIRPWVNQRIHSLYISTTEVTGAKK